MSACASFTARLNENIGIPLPLFSSPLTKIEMSVHGPSDMHSIVKAGQVRLCTLPYKNILFSVYRIMTSNTSVSPLPHVHCNICDSMYEVISHMLITLPELQVLSVKLRTTLQLLWATCGYFPATSL
jgi:hypothetical protein